MIKKITIPPLSFVQSGIIKLSLIVSTCFILSACINNNVKPIINYDFSHKNVELVIQHYQAKISQGSDFSDFDSFLADVKQQDMTSTSLASAIDCYYQQCANADTDVNPIIFRLLAIYNRLSNETTAVDLLARLVAVPTFNTDGVAAYKNPSIKKFGKLVRSIAKEYGLTYRNVNNHIFEVTLEASGDAATGERFGILTHGDVVPANIKKWVLDDGQNLDPFKLTLIDGKLYGRGTEDDKASIASALLAMKAVKESGVKLKRSIVLMIETTEETSGAGITYYLKHNKIPDYNIVLDSGYPAVTAEKGPGYIRTFFDVEPVLHGKRFITDMQASMAGNQITSSAYADIKSPSARKLKRAILKLMPDFDKAMKSFAVGQYQIRFDAQSEFILRVTVKGQSAHGSKPDEGVNPLPILAHFLRTQQGNINLTSNQYLQAVRYLDDNYGLDHFGKKLGIDFSHDFMGALTAAPTQLISHEKQLEVVVNIRVPKHPSKDIDAVIADVKYKLNQYRLQRKLHFTDTVKIAPWMLRDTKGAWLDTLLDIFHKNTGLPSEPVASAGATTAAYLPNAINFGPSMPGEKYMGHNANEFKRLKNFYMDIQMFTEMLARIGTQPRLD